MTAPKFALDDIVDVLPEEQHAGIKGATIVNVGVSPDGKKNMYHVQHPKVGTRVFEEGRLVLAKAASSNKPVEEELTELRSRVAKLESRLDRLEKPTKGKKA